MKIFAKFLVIVAVSRKRSNFCEPRITEISTHDNLVLEFRESFLGRVVLILKKEIKMTTVKSILVLNKN